MSAFKKIVDAKAAPRRTVKFPPSGFADTYQRRPRSPVDLGLRLISETEIGEAQGEAWKEGERQYPEPDDREQRVEAYNDHMMTNVLARAIVCADDVNKPYFAPAPETLIRAALMPGGIRRLWDEFNRMQIEDGPLTPEASDEELVRLGIAERVAALPDGAARRVRKLAKAMLDEIAFGVVPQGA